jgi:ankyrin repeat protein
MKRIFAGEVGRVVGFCLSVILLSGCVSGEKELAKRSAVASGPVDTTSRQAPNRPTVAQQMYDAAAKGDLATAKALLESHPEVLNATAGNAFGSTPLHFAAYNGRLAVVELLLAHNADVNVANNYGVLPLHDAANQGHKEIVALLLAHKSLVDVKDKRGKTPLQYAVERGYRDVADLLRKAGAKE